MDVMTDQEFRERIIRDVAAIQQDIKHIMRRLPCSDLESKLKFNRSLILVILTSYLGLAIYFIQK